MKYRKNVLYIYSMLWTKSLHFVKICIRIENLLNLSDFWYVVLVSFILDVSIIPPRHVKYAMYESILTPTHDMSDEQATEASKKEWRTSRPRSKHCFRGTSV